jgi:hypothetical protein
MRGSTSRPRRAATRSGPFGESPYLGESPYQRRMVQKPAKTACGNWPKTGPLVDRFRGGQNHCIGCCKTSAQSRRRWPSRLPAETRRASDFGEHPYRERGETMRSVTRAFVCLSVVSLLTVGCGGNSGSSPTAPAAQGGPALDPTCPPSSSPLTCGPVNTLTVGVKINAAGPWSFTIGSLTITGSSATYHARIIGITPGTVQVSGQEQGGTINFGLGIPQTNVGGSIPPSSVQNVNGPVTTGGGLCNLQYSQQSGSASAPISFSFSFTLNSAGAPSGQSCSA